MSNLPNTLDLIVANNESIVEPGILLQRIGDKCGRASIVLRCLDVKVIDQPRFGLRILYMLDNAAVAAVVGKRVVHRS